MRRTKKLQNIRHLGTIPQICQFMRHILTIGKQLVKQKYLPHMSLQYGELRPVAAIASVVCGTPANVHGFRVLAGLMHSTLAVGVSETLPRWTEGATYIRQGDHHVGIGPHCSLLYFAYLFWWTNGVVFRILLNLVKLSASGGLRLHDPRTRWSTGSGLDRPQ